MNGVDVFTVGSATEDTFLFVKKLNVRHSKESITGERIYFDHGSKIEVDAIHQDTGGGGTNVAAGLAKLGLKTAYFGKVGSDPAARAILQELRFEGVNVDHVAIDKSKGTGQSVIISGKGGERTVWVYRGANNDIRPKEVPYAQMLHARWVYIAPLSGASLGIVDDIVRFCRRNHIMVAMNPSSTFLKSRKNALDVLRDVNVLFLNLEEASMLTGLPPQSRGNIMRELAKAVRGVVAVTNGHQEIMVCDGSIVHTARPLRCKVVSTLGAGDAFAAGFLSQYIQHRPLEECLKTGMLNSCAVIGHIGAKQTQLTEDLLRRKRSFLRSMRTGKVVLSDLK